MDFGRRSPTQVLAALQPLVQALDREAVITSTDALYPLHSEPYAIQKQLHPAVVLVPDTVEELSAIVKFLYGSNLDFVIRGHGFKSPSARHVVVSMLKFKDLDYDPVKKIATIGASATWFEVVSFMEQVDPEYSVPAARTPSIGVTGTILNGGLSWMSTEYGGISDPINFLDAEVVKYDGTVVMASQEPGLLWALRGGGGGFGVVTKVLLRAHPYPTDIWSGMVLVPRKLLPQLVDKIYVFNHSVPHPKVNYFAYLLPKKLLATVLEGDEPDAEDSVVFHVYDALGGKHGRDVFQWLLQMPGAIDRTRVTNMKGMLEMQRNAAALRGTMRTFYAPMAVADMDQSVITRAIEFYDKIGQLDESIHTMSAVIFEFLSFRSPIGGTAEVAWPRSSGLNHLLLFIFSGPGDGPPEQEKILRQLSEDAPRYVLGQKAGDAEINPAGLEPDYHDVKGVYREHYEKLVELRRRYDPDNRFKSFF
ncbi:Putative FAD-binding domain, PCMH-type, FAD-binding, type PCMH, subdomain 2 [Colletotrichum destructivum]|uniref:FAD-binding domain, PCMH-type, FAD-binding, type PCMH, subdomain 2 n=1 Tax=Colletotrichum destructivum TaxID=34406 RepID=A0AAX4IY27_9PEZI|nr:Putative FAD-binding domain, PCMH-type, FAD-binding, type PCMH, subdomain 2 [Colletotrichum destructivum]